MDRPSPWDAISGASYATLRWWAEKALLRTRLLETPQRRGQRQVLLQAFTLAASAKVEGDYLEFGVYQGENMVSAWQAARVTGRREMDFFAFDSFQGLPDPAQSPVDMDGEFTKGQFAAGRAEFDRNLRRAGVDMDRVVVVEGFYETRLRDLEPRDIGLHAASVVWIDCDLYGSTVCALDFVSDVVQDGTVLLFDDWYCFRARPDRGEQLACREWLERNPDIRLVPYRDFHWAGRAFVVNRD
jgi:O-methyltransferase